MSKPIKILLFGFSALALICICITSAIALFVWSGINSIENWKQEDVKWEQVELPINNSKVKVSFAKQNAHPFLAEYNYKIISENSAGTTENLLPMNTGGDINEEYRIIEFENQTYIFIRDTLINLNTGKTISSDYTEPQDLFSPVLVSGTITNSGLVTNPSGILKIIQNQTIDSTKYRYGNWIEVDPTRNSKFKYRYIFEKNSKSNSIEYIEIDNGYMKITLVNTQSSYLTTTARTKIVLYSSNYYLVFIDDYFGRDMLDFKTGMIHRNNFASGSTSTSSNSEGKVLYGNMLFDKVINNGVVVTK